MGIRLLRWLAPETIPFFRYSYLLNVFFAIVFTQAFLLEHGDPFTGMGDDFTIHQIAIDNKNGIESYKDGLAWSGLNYKAYITALSLWLKVLNLAGFSSDYFLNLIILNSWMGAFVSPVIYLIFKKFTTDENSSTIAWITLLYPLSIYYSATIIRDIVVTLFFSIGVLVMLTRFRSKLLKFLLLSFCVFVLYHIREASGFFLFIFLITHYVLRKTGGSLRYVIRASILAVLMFVFSILLTALSMRPPKELPPMTHFMAYLSHRIHFYNDAAISQATESLGAEIRKSGNPVLLVLSLPHLFFSPVPPRFFFGMTTSNIFLGIGNLVWYFFGFFYLFSFINLPSRGEVNSFWWAALITAFAALLIINFTSGDVRHFSFIHPVLIGFAFIFIKNNKAAFGYLMKTFLLFALIIVLAYTALKLVN
ncbi:hypothetical protein KK083_28775 [Fulvivirgaceae bacterium PWU4]|uniref:Uncharacterized protein n=1 Tax=Chryseosolibacter histidini TaxID=2782349 RepID=A0AAP2DQY9_9BACT|nr:hypothetical protein [Chryseosolibacter histidini]MBT1700921.1 hypothetical protein [Chryseosolibacter histidini]